MKNTKKLTKLAASVVALCALLLLGACDFPEETTSSSNTEATSATYTYKADGIARYDDAKKYSYTNSEVNTLKLNSDGTWTLKITGKHIYAYDANATGVENESAFTITYSNNYFMFEGTYTGKPASDGTVELKVTREYSLTKLMALEEETVKAKKTKTVSVTAQKVPLENTTNGITYTCTVQNRTLSGLRGLDFTR